MKEISIQNLILSLLAIVKLRDKYNNPAKIKESCPLCDMVIKINGDSCDPCPWVWLEGISDNNRIFPPCRVVGFKQQTIPERLARCDRWLAVIEDEMERRGWI